MSINFLNEISSSVKWIRRPKIIYGQRNLCKMRWRASQLFVAINKLKPRFVLSIYFFFGSRAEAATFSSLSLETKLCSNYKWHLLTKEKTILSIGLCGACVKMPCEGALLSLMLKMWIPLPILCVSLKEFVRSKKFSVDQQVFAVLRIFILSFEHQFSQIHFTEAF